MFNTTVHSSLLSAVESLSRVRAKTSARKHEGRNGSNRTKRQRQDSLESRSQRGEHHGELAEHWGRVITETREPGLTGRAPGGLGAVAHLAGSSREQISSLTLRCAAQHRPTPSTGEEPVIRKPDCTNKAWGQRRRRESPLVTEWKSGHAT